MAMNIEVSQRRKSSNGEIMPFTKLEKCFVNEH